MPTQDSFPTKIYIELVENNEDVQTEIANIIDILPFKRTGKVFAHGNEITDVTRNILLDFHLEKTSKMIDFHLRKYCEDLNFPFRKYRLYAWFTKNGPGDFLYPHHHNDVDITGTYYFQSNSNDGDIFFESPVGPAPHSLCYSSQHKELFLTPQVGKLIFFPGWIKHGVLRNTSEDSVRIGISFNISFER